VGRGGVPEVDVVLLCVPDAAIPEAAAAVAGAATFVGHVSGATGLDALAPAARAGAEVFSLHPLQTFAGGPVSLAGAACAVSGSSPEALAVAAGLGRRLSMEPIQVEDSSRAAYHAAASIASNFVVSLLWASERMAATTGMDRARARRALGPLVRQTVDNWIQLGSERALTGPVARGDEASVGLQRSAVAEHYPELAPVFDALVALTRALASERAGRIA
jgi:predicted short-subunit dehydrogenase-like oxidoreductase (DUF2520 family)